MIVPLIQDQFSGGMNLYDEDTLIADNEYREAFNLRNRKSSLEPVKFPLEDTTAPVGKKQGLFAFDKYLLLFCNGWAYYKDIFAGDVSWTRIENFAMSTTADNYYVQVVPAATFLYERKLANADKIDGSTLETNLNVTTIRVNGSNAGLVVQDGENQPWLILPDATARRTQTYEEWTIANREYVPVMKQMAYVDGILFGVAADGRTLYRSLTGRPLDFVINVKVDGDKGGDASTTSHSVGYDTVTCLYPMVTGELLVATTKNVFPITLNRDITIFGEPTFINNQQISVGVVNQQSFVNAVFDNGYLDYLFIDTDGIRSLNSALQKNEGRNQRFSSMINPALGENLKQDSVYSAVVEFNDYVLFAVKTSEYGYLIAVYDKTRQQWVCFDDFNIDAIKQFAVADQSSNPVLYAITESKVYQLYQAEEYDSSVVLRANTSGAAKSEVRLVDLYAVFDRSFSEAEVTATEILMNRPRKIVKQELANVGTINATYGELDNKRFNFKVAGSGTGWKVASKLSWQNSAKLVLVESDIEGITQGTPTKQQAESYRR